MDDHTVILGGGVTGLGAGLTSGFPVYEAHDFAGGICASYYMRSGSTQRLSQPPSDDEAYRFELGGGHWIFGADEETEVALHLLSPMKRYTRRSSVYFPKAEQHVPYPLQEHLYCFPQIATKALHEMEQQKKPTDNSMDAWLCSRFGDTLYDMFFGPFHALYTAGLYKTIAPQDPYKSLLDFDRIRAGMTVETGAQAGYNASFLYPEKGLDAFIRALASRCNMHYGKRVERIHVPTRHIYFSDGMHVSYSRILSTLPLQKLIELAGLDAGEPTAPSTSVLVLNIGATRGDTCPESHWVYVPESRSGFCRVGFYSNVDASFLPASKRESNSHVSIYVERAYRTHPTQKEIDAYTASVIQELQEWGFIETVECADPTWIETAYTWRIPGSVWVEESIALLQEHNITSIGRYGRWFFQGIVQSLKEGLAAGRGVSIDEISIGEALSTATTSFDASRHCARRVA